MQDHSSIKLPGVFFLAAFLFGTGLCMVHAAEDAPPADARSDFLRCADGRIDELGRRLTFEKGKVKIKFGGELRYRLEYKDDFNFNNATYEDDAVNLFRN